MGQKSLENNGNPQKKPVGETTGSKRRRPDSNRGWRICNPFSDSCNQLVGQPLTETPGPSCTISRTKTDELAASDELLAELVENGEDVLPSGLESGLRFVVQHWLELSEADQRAVLAIVRRAGNAEVPG